jgi:excinuclease ABC subunit B
MAKFKLNSDYQPKGDQPNAIKILAKSITDENQYQTLVGVTGSGKTFTMANIIETMQMPTLIMTHNKTLAAQLYSEFRGFFPTNHVEYFISYYDYYQPEAYIPRQDLFIEKDSSINEELERMRLSATASLMSYEDVIVVASVSANYGLGAPDEYQKMVVKIEIGDEFNQREFLLRLIEMGYKRNDTYFDRGDVRVNGDVLDIFPAYNEEVAIRIEFFGDDVESIFIFDWISGEVKESVKSVTIYAASNFIVGAERLQNTIRLIEEELDNRLDYFHANNQLVEAQRLQQRVEFDLEMLKATGACKGIENYSRYLAGKGEGETPYTLLDYFEMMNRPYLLIVDESHVSLPQFRGMYAGDRSRKEVLVNYGFRLPSALDNRPLMYDEFIVKAPHYLFVSATPKEDELERSGLIATQVIRPTGLLDPEIEIKSSDNQVAQLFDEAKKTIAKGERILVTTLTKKMSEELQKYYLDLGLKVKYMHSDIDTIERIEIIRGLRNGEFDMLIGINLLREGLDIPEVSLVAVLDADKEGFLRSETSLIQTMGRAARNANGRVILFANRMTGSMERAIKTTTDRRKMQDDYNKEHGITPQTVIRKVEASLGLTDHTDALDAKARKKLEKIPAAEKKKIITELQIRMKEAAKKLEFEEAARLRDEIAKIRAM